MGNEPNPRDMTIGEVSARSGVAPSALRYYEERGLIASVRAPSGHRRFGRPVLRRLAFIVFAQRAGCTLEEVRSALDRLPSDRVPGGDDWNLLTQPWLERIDARIQELERLRHELSACIGCGCLSVEACALVNPDDRAAEWGPGPVRWGPSST